VIRYDFNDLRIANLLQALLIYNKIITFTEIVGAIPCGCPVFTLKGNMFKYGRFDRLSDRSLSLSK